MRRLLKWQTWKLRGTTATETALVLGAATLIVHWFSSRAQAGWPMGKRGRR